MALVRRLLASGATFVLQRAVPSPVLRHPATWLSACKFSSQARLQSGPSAPPSLPPNGAASRVTVTGLQHPFSMHGRVVVKKLLEAGAASVGESVVVGGWVRAGRTAEAGTLAFLDVSDGSCLQNLPCIIPAVGFTATISLSTSSSSLTSDVHPTLSDVHPFHAAVLIWLLTWAARACTSSSR